MAITIRPAVPADRAFVLGLAGRMADFDPPPWRTRAELIAGDRRALESWFDSPADGEAMLIAEVDGAPSGCAYLLTVVDYFTGGSHGHLSVLPCPSRLRAWAWVRRSSPPASTGLGYAGRTG